MLGRPCINLTGRCVRLRRPCVGLTRSFFGPERAIFQSKRVLHWSESMCCHKKDLCHHERALCRPFCTCSKHQILATSFQIGTENINHWAAGSDWTTIWHHYPKSTPPETPYPHTTSPPPSARYLTTTPWLWWSGASRTHWACSTRPARRTTTGWGRSPTRRRTSSSSASPSCRRPPSKTSRKRYGHGTQDGHGCDVAMSGIVWMLG